MSNVGFSFEGLMIERIIAHRIFPRTPDKQMVAPKLSNQLITLKQDALDALQVRITEALANKSHGIEMSITDTGDDSFFTLTASVLHVEGEPFINVSKRLAGKLTEAQYGAGKVSGGVLIIITGKVGEQSYPFLAVLRAEMQNGFRTNDTPEQIAMEYIADLLLTPTQRLYKIGVLIECESGHDLIDGRYDTQYYRSFLFDHLMTSTETKNAAGYFYSAFLGMGIEKSSKKLTQDFFEHTRSFINQAPVDEESKFDLHESLRSEMRSQKATLSTASFAVEHLPQELQADYQSFMVQKGFPQNAVSKDTDYIKKKLRRRSKLVFTSDVWVSIPPDQVKELVQIEQTDDDEFTTLKVKGRLRSQE
ncbi:nucleoid-associated protein [Salmonella enterica]|nr:nucleoid-associated protein [Salmonella enterica]EGB1974376.1 nucleoid-associated protein [Salmonella enterica]EIF5205445.1 nucleoid-associated protein [Salmonella enterica]ELF3806032.1 nucleoid-associated protein [Salmonella enterica]ELY9432803.1 nucleoid-associated protein [Salmonella enterica]